MKRRRTKRPLRSISDINMTPLIDLTFLLLITFIITFPLIEQGIAVRLPTAPAEPLESVDAVSISLDEAGALYLDQGEVTLPGLEQALRERVAQSPELSVMIRADERLPYGEVVSVLRVLRRLRISRMALVTQDEG